MGIGRYPLAVRDFSAFPLADVIEGAFQAIGTPDADGNPTCDLVSSDTAPVLGVAQFDQTVASGQPASLQTGHGTFARIKASGAIAVGDEIMCDTTATKEGFGKVATTGKRVVAIAIEAAVDGDFFTGKLTDYFKP